MSENENNNEVRKGWICPTCGISVNPTQNVCPICQQNKLKESAPDNRQVLLG